MRAPGPRGMWAKRHRNTPSWWEPPSSGYQRGGFWSWLLGEEPDQTQQYAAYDTSLASGDTVVTVTVDDLHADAVMGILTQHGPHDIHENPSGSDTYQTGSTAEPMAQTPGTSGVADRKQEEVIPLAEEELQ